MLYFTANKLWSASQIIRDFCQHTTYISYNKVNDFVLCRNNKTIKNLVYK
ncbi:hypothetical protein X975_05859, partial [Stegodyphus mimosarum]